MYTMEYYAVILKIQLLIPQRGLIILKVKIKNKIFLNFNEILFSNFENPVTPTFKYKIKCGIPYPVVQENILRYLNYLKQNINIQNKELYYKAYSFKSNYRKK